jgi:hypothetical protein
VFPPLTWADPVVWWCRIQVFPPLTLSRSNGWVMHAAPALASPPKYHRAIRFFSAILK